MLLSLVSVVNAGIISGGSITVTASSTAGGGPAQVVNSAGRYIGPVNGQNYDPVSPSTWMSSYRNIVDSAFTGEIWDFTTTNYPDRVSFRSFEELPANNSDGETTSFTSAGELLSYLDFDVDANSFYFVQLTDIHIYCPDDVVAPSFAATNVVKNLLATLEEINGFDPKPAFVVITGDLVHDSKVAQFELFKETMESLDSNIPTHYTLGNHDGFLPASYSEVFPDRENYYSFIQGGVRFLVLNNAESGMSWPTSMELKNDQYAWAYSELQKGTPSVILMHFPLIARNGEEVGKLREQLFGLAKKFKNIKLICSGHWHQNHMSECQYLGINPIPLITTPSATTTGTERGYRIIGVKDENIAWTAFKPLGGTFRIDPPSVEFPVYVPLPNVIEEESSMLVDDMDDVTDWTTDANCTITAENYG